MTDELKQEMTEKFNSAYGEEVKIGLREALRKIYIDGAEHGYQYALQHPQWIPVEEELPEKEKDNPSLSVNVIVTDGSSAFESYYNFNLHMWAGAHIYGTITHWMSLPQAPRKEE